MRDNVRDYYQLRFAGGKMFDEEEIMKDLSPLLRQRILEWNAKEMLTTVPLLKDAPPSFTSTVAARIAPHVSFENDTVFSEGHTADAMYFIYSGKIKIQVGQFRMSETGDGNMTEVPETLVTIGPGCYFGEVPLLVSHQPKRSGTAIAAEVCNLYVLEAEDLKDLMHDFPSIANYMTKVAATRLSRSINFKVKDGAPPLDMLRAPPVLADMTIDEEDLKTEYFQAKLTRSMQRAAANGGPVENPARRRSTMH